MTQRNALTADEQLDAEPAPITATDADFKSIADAARDVVRLENDIARLTALIENLTAELTIVQTMRLPEAMAKAGISSFELAKGWLTKLKEFVTASIPKDEELYDAGLRHLEKIGAGSIIKRTVTISFPKGEEEWAKKFIRDMAQRKRPLNAVINEAVHYQTLGKLVRERREQGNLTDDDRRLLGVHEIVKAVVERPKPNAPTGGEVEL